MLSVKKRAKKDYLYQPMGVDGGFFSFGLKTLILFLVAIFLSIVAWSYHTTVPELVSAQGEVVPIDRVYKIQHLEGGIVDKIHVTNGQLIRTGDLLVTLDGTSLQSELKNRRATHSEMSINIQRLDALLNKVKPEFSDLSESGSFIKMHTELYHSQVLSALKRQESIDQALKNQALEEASKLRQYEAVANEVKVLRQQSEMRKRLHEKNQLSTSELLEMQARLASAISRLSEVDYELTAIKNQRPTLLNEKEAIYLEWKERLSEEKSEAIKQQAIMSEQVVELESRIMRLQVKSPIDGIVKGLDIKSINSVVAPGEVFVELVPISKKLLVEVKIEPEKIGHITTGLPVDIKVSSFDYQKFGSLSGKVNAISPSTYLETDGSPYYLTEVEIPKNFVGAKPEENIILPGMTVRADIMTGQKTILDYLLKPIYRGFDRALTEQ